MPSAGLAAGPATVLDALDAKVAVVCAEGRLVAVNRRWSEAAERRGGGQSCSLGADYLAVCDATEGEGAEAARQVASAIRSVLRGDAERQRVEYHCPGPNREAWFEARVTPVVVGDALGCVVAHIDVTDQVGLRQMEQRARLAELELERKLAQSNKLEAIGELAAGIAHEINTPVQYVGDNITFLAQGFDELQALLESADSLLRVVDEAAHPEPAPVRDYLETVDEDLDFLAAEIPDALDQAREGVERIREIVRAMKEFSHPSGRERADVDLNRTLQTAATVTRNVWRYVADLTFDLDDDLPPVPCYLGPFNQVVVNLLVNAAQAFEEQNRPTDGGLGRLTIATRRTGSVAEITVADDGPGIPPEAVARIFDPFFTTKEVGRGTGQGLAIAHQIVVNQHGGTLSVDTVVGQGTTFTITLPLKPDDLIPDREDDPR